MRTYKIELTIETKANHTMHAVNRVRKALHQYAGGGVIKVVDIQATEVAASVGVGSLFRMDGTLHAIVSCGITSGPPYVLTSLETGYWRCNGSILSIVSQMMKEADEWTLIKPSKLSTPGVDWTGNIKLEDLTL